jgi:hypothetical protein
LNVSAAFLVARMGRPLYNPRVSYKLGRFPLICVFINIIKIQALNYVTKY